MGVCLTTGSGDNTRCDNNGNNAGTGAGVAVCLSNGISASGSSSVCTAGSGPITGV